MRYPIPGLPTRDILKAEISREIDHLFTLLNKCRDRIHCHRMRRGEKDNITVLKMDVCRILKRQIDTAAQTREKLVNPHSRFSTRGKPRHFNLGMRQQQTDEFDPGVTRCSYNANFNHFRPKI